MRSLCGIDCTACGLRAQCAGCAETCGHPFGGECLIAPLCRYGASALHGFKEKLLQAFHSLGIEALDEVADLYPLKGSFINLEYTLPGGQAARFWADDAIYLGNQVRKGDSGRCYGLAADAHFMMVSEYNEDGSDAQILLFRRWNP